MEFSTSNDSYTQINNFHFDIQRMLFVKYVYLLCIYITGKFTICLQTLVDVVSSLMCPYDIRLLVILY